MSANKETEEAHATFPNKFEAFYLIAVLIAVEILVALALRDSSLLADVDWQGSSGFATVVGNGFLFVFLLTYKKMSYRSLFHPAKRSVKETLGRLLVPIALLIPGLMLLTGVLNSAVLWFWPMSIDEQETFSDMVALSVIPLFFSCVAAPLLEEMLFRGIVLRSFLQQYSRTEAILWSATIFGLAHLNPYQFFTALILGLVLGWLYERTRSLLPSIFLHGAFNGFVSYTSQESSSLGQSWTWFLGIAFFGAITGGMLLLRALEPAGQRNAAKHDSEL